MSSTSDSPLDGDYGPDHGGNTYARYRFQAHVALRYCLDCAVNGVVQRVALEHGADLLLETERGFRFIQIKTHDEGSWTTSKMLGTGVVGQLWANFLADPNLNATYEAFLSGTTNARDPLSKSTGLVPATEVLDACRTYIAKEHPATRLDLLKDFLPKLRVLSIPVQSAMWDHNLALIVEARPHLSGGEVVAVRESIMKALDKAFDKFVGVAEWSELMLRGDAAELPSLRARKKTVGGRELEGAFRILSGGAPAAATSEELNLLYDDLRTVSLDRCLRFRPLALRVDQIEEFCMPAQVRRVDDRGHMTGARLPGSSGPGYEYDSRLAADDSPVRDGGALPQPMNHVLTGPAGARAPDTVILGHPGQGKTTGLYLWAAARYGELVAHYARGEATSEDAPFPVLVLPLKGVPDLNEAAGTLVEQALDVLFDSLSLKHRRPDALRAHLLDRIERGQVELGLDALDELAPGRESWLQDQLTLVRRVRVVLTARPSAEDSMVRLDAPTRFEVARFSRNQSEEYMRRYLLFSGSHVELRAAVFGQLDESIVLRALLEVPLLLAIACETLASGSVKSLPNSRASLLSEGIVRMMRRENERAKTPRSRSRERAKERALEQLAWRFLVDRPVTINEDEALEELDALLGDLAPFQEVQEIWDELVRDGLLTRDREGRFSFVLRSFHESCAARYVGRKLNTLTDDAFRDRVTGRGRAWQRDDWGALRPLDAPGWREIWPLVASALTDPLPLIESVGAEFRCREDVLGTRAVLAAHVVGNASESSRAGSTEITAQVADALLQTLFSGALGEAERTTLAVALGMLPAAGGEAKLLEALDNESLSNQVREIAAEALGHIGGRVAREALKRVAIDESSAEALRGSAVVALGRVGGEDAARTVRRLWGQRVPQRVRMACMVTLADLGDVESLELLVELMLDDQRPWDLRDFAMRETSRRGLAAGAPWARALLGEPVSSTDPKGEAWRLRESCAAALGELQDLDAVPALGQLGRDERSPEPVWRECLESLGEIGTSAAREELCKCSGGGPRFLAAACALGLLGEDSPVVVDLLSDVLARRDYPASIRFPVAEALGRIASEQAEEALLARLSDPDEHDADLVGCVLRVVGARSGDREQRSRRESLVRQLLDSPEARIRIAAARYLAPLCQRTPADTGLVTRALHEAILDKDLGNAVQAKALAAFSMFDSDRARDAISKVLEQGDDWLHRSALTAANTQTLRFGRRLLLSGVWSDP